MEWGDGELTNQHPAWKMAWEMPQERPQEMTWKMAWEMPQERPQEMTWKMAQGGESLGGDLGEWPGE